MKIEIIGQRISSGETVRTFIEVAEDIPDILLMALIRLAGEVADVKIIKAYEVIAEEKCKTQCDWNRFIEDGGKVRYTEH